MSPLYSRPFGFVQLAFVYFCLSPVIFATAKNDPCVAYDHCSECVFDAYDRVLGIALDCAWCPGKHTCMQFNATMITSPNEKDTEEAPNVCPDMRHVKYNPTCPEMSCSAAQTTNNRYICRPAAIITFVFLIVLFLYNVFFYLWLSTVRQLPWKYEPWLTRLRAGCPEQEALEFMRADSTVIPSTEEALKTQGERQNGTNGVLQNKTRHSPRTGAPSNCPICKMAQPFPLGPGRVCFWCDIARFGFLVFYIAFTSSVSSLVLLFSVSLKPWFADTYFTCIILISYAAHCAFALYVFYFREKHVHTEEARKTLYIELTLFLRGRSILNVIPALQKKVNVHDNDTVRSPSTVSRPKEPHLTSSIEAAVFITSPTTTGFLGETSKLTQLETLQKKGETAQLLSSSCLDQQFRNILRQTIGREELILWWEKPDVSSIVSYDAWLIIDLSVGVALGLWLIVSSTVKDPQYLLIRIIGPTSMGVIGAIFVLVFACLFVMVLKSCRRLYFLTDRRLLTIYSGLVSPTVSDTQLQGVRFASVYGYKDWNSYPVLAFSWEEPVTERKLLTIKGHSFPGVISLQDFLYYFNKFAPPLPKRLYQNKEEMRHCRQVWRMYLFFCVLFMEFLPIFTLYPLMMPGFYSFILFLLLTLLLSSTIHRGLRVQHVTYAPLSVAGSWAGARQRQGSEIGACASSSTTLSSSRIRAGSDTQPAQQAAGPTVE